MSISLKNLLGCIFILICCNPSIAQEKEATIVLSRAFPAVLNTYINFKHVTIKVGRNIEKMPLMINHINMDKPTHLYYGVLSANSTNEKKFRSLLMLPNDSIVMAENGTHIKFTKGYGDFIDNLISIEQIYPQKNLDSFSSLSELNEAIKRIDNTYLANEKRIKTTTLDEKHRKALLAFNYIVKCASFTNDSFQKLIFQNEGSTNQILDSIYSDMINNHIKFDQVNSSFVNSIYFALVNFHLTKQGVLPKDKWNNLSKFATLPIFKKIVMISLNNSNDMEPKERDLIYGKLKTAGLIDQEITDLYLELKRIKPNLTNIPPNDTEKIILVNVENQPTTLKSLLSEHRGKFILIDFWASWCIPCRSEFPASKDAIAQLKNQNIAFINISIDEDNKTIEWKNALQEEGLIGSKNQFRMVDWKNSSFTRLLSLNAIPRYVLIDKSGQIQNIDYYRPSDPRFMEDLKAYLQQ